MTSAWFWSEGKFRPGREIGRRWLKRPTPRNDDGAVLVLALIFTVIISVSVLALLSLTGTDLLNTSNLKGTRDATYAADGATSVAIQSVRYSQYYYPGSFGSPCTPSSVAITIDGEPMMVYCQGTQDAGSNPTRVVTFYAVPASDPSCPSTMTSGAWPACQAAAIIEAEVAFDDFAAGAGGYDNCPPSGQNINNPATCGSGQEITSWVVENDQ